MTELLTKLKDVMLALMSFMQCLVMLPVAFCTWAKAKLPM